MSSLREEIALEEHAIEELDAESAKLWNSGHYGLARIASREAHEARQRLKELRTQEETK